MKLGDRVIVSAVLIRRTRSWRGGQRLPKEWERTPIAKHTTLEGVYIGKRTLWNGYSEYAGDEGMVFMPTEHFTAALVVFNERDNPRYVPMDAITEAL